MNGTIIVIKYRRQVEVSHFILVVIVVGYSAVVCCLLNIEIEHLNISNVLLILVISQTKKTTRTVPVKPSKFDTIGAVLAAEEIAHKKEVRQHHRQVHYTTQPGLAH